MNSAEQQPPPAGVYPLAPFIQQVDRLRRIIDGVEDEDQPGLRDKVATLEVAIKDIRVALVKLSDRRTLWMQMAAHAVTIIVALIAAWAALAK